jgi:hypothetical protein
VRVAKTDAIAGVPAELARAIVRRFSGMELTTLAVADLLDGTGHEPGTVLAQLEADGYMEKVETDAAGETWWDTTIQGNALAMASFGKPISRKDRRPAGHRRAGPGTGLQRLPCQAPVH